ncbi:hypothetical protein [Microbacterium sp. K24]|uniref:hypothetical protein n=1 Tax=Microbacterium sp. K24 TaxID=2305446 RepID=UPI00109CB130|nr:hypothetical protein [Microbacterium sp. K24]
MKKIDRQMATSLESILTRHTAKREAIEERTLTDLRTAGFTQVRSVPEAYERLEAQRELAGFTQAQIDVVMYQRRSREKKGLVA